MAKWEDYLEEGHFAKILTVGGFVAVAIGVSYAIRGYLDVLRIKRLRHEINGEGSALNDTKTDEKWVLDDEY